MNSEIFTRRTGTPTFCAALASPPAAKIQLPNRVLASVNAQTAASANHHSDHLGNPWHERQAVVEHLHDTNMSEPDEQSLEGDALEQRMGEPVLRGDVADAGDDRAVGEHHRQREREAAQDKQEASVTMNEGSRVRITMSR